MSSGRRQKKIERRGPLPHDLERKIHALEMRLRSLEAPRHVPPIVQTVETEAPDMTPSKAVAWFDDRFYRIPAESGPVFLPSVTTVLGVAYPHHALDEWRVRVGAAESRRVMRQAADRGTIVHDACAVYAMGGVVVYQSGQRRHSAEELEAIRQGYEHVAVLYDQEHMLMAHRFARWLDTLQASVQASELTVYSLKHGIAGTLDLVLDIPAGTYAVNGSTPVRIPGGAYVCDIKTGNNVYDSHYLQIAAYAQMWAEPSDAEPDRAPLDGGIVVHLNADTRSGIPGVATHVRTMSQMKDDWTLFRHVLKLYESTSQLKPKVFDLPTYLRRTHGRTTAR